MGKNSQNDHTIIFIFRITNSDIDNLSKNQVLTLLLEGPTKKSTLEVSSRGSIA